MWSNDYSSPPPSKPDKSGVNLPRDSEGNTYLHDLCRRDAPPELIREAVEKLGADVNRLNKKNMPPLGLAIQSARPETVACLIELGANVFFPVNPSANFNAAWLAAVRGKDRALSVILDKGGGFHVNSTGIDTDGYPNPLPALHAAVKNAGNPAILDKLVQAGATVNTEAGYDKATPLMLAISANSGRAVRQLLDLGADLERPQGPTGRTPLCHAAWHRDYSAALTLLNFGANPDTPDSDGKTPLMHAAENGDMSMVQALLKAGADVNARRAGSSRETPLMLAAKKGSHEIVRLLLKSGADPTLADAFNKTAAQYAEGWNLRETLDGAEKVALAAQFENSYRKYRP